MNCTNKYISLNDKVWDICINAIGNAEINAFESYPPNNHPLPYYFNWNIGRVLSEFQLIYIETGKGIFENKYGKYDIQAGDFIILFPEEWHRYKPDKEVGWTEHYVGFDGKIASDIIGKMPFRIEKPIIRAKLNTEIIYCYNNILDILSQEQSANQLISGGELLKLLGLIIAQQDEKIEKIEDTTIEIINKIKRDIHENIECDIDFKILSKRYNIGYSHFRKMFKKLTGVSPKQYLIHHKLLKAKEMLTATDKTVKEICYDLGFESTSYFSRIFKSKLGGTPLQIKEKMNKYIEAV